MKEKIANALKTKYKSFGLSNEAFGRIASAKEKTVTEESQIEAAIEDVETWNFVASELQKMRDSEIQKRTDAQRAFDAYKELHPETKAEETKAEDNEPEWAKNLREQNERILAAQARRDSDAKAAATLASVKSALENAGCSNAGILGMTLKGFSLADGETEGDAVTRLTGEYNANVKAVFGDAVVPPAGGGQGNPDPAAAREAHNSYLRKRGLLPKE